MKTILKFTTTDFRQTQNRRYTMTQTASISSIDKKRFLKKAFKSFCGSNGKTTKETANPPFPVPEKDKNQS